MRSDDLDFLVSDSAMHSVAATAAQLIVDEGLEYGPAKRRAVKQLGLPPRTPLPGNDEVEAQVRDYIDLFCADTQPVELQALRRLALQWMERLHMFRPHLSGAVWHGTATRRSDIYLQLFCDDSKSAEISLIDLGIAYEPRTVNGFRHEPVEALSCSVPCPELRDTVGVHLMVHDADDIRGALLKDPQGRKPRGDAAALRALLALHEVNE